MTFPGYVKPTGVMIDAGVLYRRIPSGATLIGVGASVGGLSFNPNTEMRNVEFDGRTSMLEGLDRITQNGAEISGSLIDVSVANFGMYEPGSTSFVSGSSTVIVPLQATAFLAAGAYIKDLLYIGRRQDNGIVVVGFPRALVSKYQFKSEDKNETKVEVTIEARLPATATNINDAPYRIMFANDLTTLDGILPTFWNLAGYAG